MGRGGQQGMNAREYDNEIQQSASPIRAAVPGRAKIGVSRKLDLQKQLIQINLLLAGPKIIQQNEAITLPLQYNCHIGQ